ncbi:MAG: hypothetical protein R2707_05090 [Acidimicrobiales bacterium]
MIPGLPSLAGTQRYLIYGYALLLSGWLVAEPFDWSTSSDRHPVRMVGDLLSSMSGTATFAAISSLALVVGSVVAAVLPSDFLADFFLGRMAGDEEEVDSMAKLVDVRSELMAQGLTTRWDGGMELTRFGGHGLLSVDHAAREAV